MWLRKYQHFFVSVLIVFMIRTPTFLSSICSKIWPTSPISVLTHWGLVTPFGDIDLGQYWLTQVMACCLTALSHYLNQCWLIISKVWHSSEGNFIRDIPQPPFIKVSLKITYLKLNWNLPGANNRKCKCNFIFSQNNSTHEEFLLTLLTPSPKHTTPSHSL